MTSDTQRKEDGSRGTLYEQHDSYVSHLTFRFISIRCFPDFDEFLLSFVVLPSGRIFVLHSRSKHSDWKPAIKFSLFQSDISLCGWVDRCKMNCMLIIE